MGARQCSTRVSTRDLMRERMTRHHLCRAFVALAIAFVALGRVGAAFEEYDHGEDGSHHSRHERRHEKTTMSEYVRYMRTDFYGALNVTKDANATTISKRYRQLALKFHPDKLERTATAREARAARETFEVIAEAKEVLLDEERRKEYDDIIASMPRFARPKFGKRSLLARNDVKFSAWLVLSAFAAFCVAFASVAQYTSRAADKESLIQSSFFQQKFKSRNKNVPKPERVDVETFFQEFLVEYGLTDLTGWEHTTGGRLWARARGKKPASVGVDSVSGSEEDPSNVDGDSDSTRGEDAAATTAAKRRGKKKGKNKGRRDGAPKLAASARADMALRHIRAEGEHRRGLYGDSGEYDD